MTIVEVDKAICKYEPRGDNGLEGYQLNNIYKFEYIDTGISFYYRMYIKEDYYETCSVRSFNKYFNKIVEPELFVIDRADPFIYIDVRDKGIVQIMDHKDGIRIMIFKLDFGIDDDPIHDYFIGKEELR